MSGTATPVQALLARSAIDLDDPALADLVGDLQGNILKSHGRNNSIHVFLRFGPRSESVRGWLRGFAVEVTSARAQAAQTRDHVENGAWHPFVNLMLSASGYQALGIPPEAQPPDPAFRAGMKDPAAGGYVEAALGQPVRNPLVDRLDDWDPPFRQRIDALIIMAYGGIDLSAEAARAMLDQRVGTLRASLDGVAEVVHVEHGHVLRDPSGQPIEHFGFVDGISNPLFLADDLERAARAEGAERYDPSAPLNLVLVPEPDARQPHACGSYVAYRKLQQNIRGFHRRIDQLAAALSAASGESVDRELAGAYAVGRFKDGTPVVDYARAAAGRAASNFNYDDDPAGTRCPFHAHTRKTNPRGELARARAFDLDLERRRRLVRRAISYGPPDLDPAEEWTDAGLLFLCAMSDIAGQFIAQQQGWCNRNSFLFRETGIDPVVGSPLPDDRPCRQRWPLRWGQADTAERLAFDVGGCVRCRGGEYFFVPSLSFLGGL